MAKRHKLNYNSDELVHHLRQSTGQGVDAFFSAPSPPRSVTTAEQPGQKGQDESIQPSLRARTRARRQANNHSSVEAELRERILVKRHLSSFTFRFQPEELEALDQVTDEVNRHSRHKTSKNDVMRLALNWLLRDHREKKENSMLVKVLTRR